MSALNPEALDASALIAKALPAHQQAEAGIARLLKALQDPIAGRLITMPGNKSVQVNGPTPVDVMVTMVQSQAVLLQSIRLTMLALESLVPGVHDLAPLPTSPPSDNGGQPPQKGM